jgi:Tfp pilus assembly protein FimV
MKHCNCTALLAVILSVGWLPTVSHAESKRIVVYPLTQSYVDTQPGDTLSIIAAKLLPNNSQLQQKLMAEILKLNPDAFINHDPNRLLANIRLWLPNQRDNAVHDTDPRHYQVEHFSWGSIRRPR